ncbi:hypothetical protein GQ55_9G393300 [Panicum hallii var. hallii]|uniref:Uncharacterized protein n=1 Tax=Panicum hallii var. hallii TaxID=1504633 RepID=A0A2T7C9X0_9POAL|nr:hypothetical protein GQ55_9G393300 [Panicum hallii var. hallii]
MTASGGSRQPRAASSLASAVAGGVMAVRSRMRIASACRPRMQWMATATWSLMASSSSAPSPRRLSTRAARSANSSVCTALPLSLLAARVDTSVARAKVKAETTVTRRWSRSRWFGGNEREKVRRSGR